MMPSRAGLESSTMRSKRLTRVKAASACILGPCSRRSCSSGASGQPSQRPPSRISKSAGRMILMRSGSLTIDAGSLAVPDAEHAIDLGAGKHSDLLAAPHRRCRQILVESRCEFDVVLLEEGFRAPQRVIVHAERRAAVTGDEARGVEALRAV